MGGADPDSKSILLVDDHPVVRSGLALMLRASRRKWVSSEAATVREALDRARVEVPDLLVTDLELGSESGLDLIEEAHARFPRLPILAISAYPRSLFEGRALRSGAAAYLRKDAPAAGFLEVVESLILVGAPPPARLPDAGSDPLERLSNRELHVWMLLSEGKTAGKIGDLLCVTVKTVETHLLNIREKLGVEGNRQLQFLAYRWAETRHSA